ncbi:MAG: DUF2339 domain-containing protein [Moraxellaceae bacterium]|nr:DUF2339 domain-containing protein [Moraxellaceae bacterium]
MEGLAMLGVLLAVGYLIVLPVLTIIAWRRGERLEEEVRALRATLGGLLQRLARVEAGQSDATAQTAPREAPVATPVPVAAVTPVVAAPSVASPAVVVDSSTVAMPSALPEPVAAPAAPTPPTVTPAAPHVPDAPPTRTTPPVTARTAAVAGKAADGERDSLPNPLSGLIRWFLQGNPLAKLGVLLLFFGLAYLMNYAADRNLFPIELRLVTAAGIAGGLLTLGWRLRAKAPLYALILQGGAIGALYITCFAAFRLYTLLPHSLSLALMLGICAASVALAVLQRAQSLAVLASIGGYLAPVLLSTGGGSHVALFSYYGLLTLGILAVSLWQSWRPLNLVGFVFTFGVGLWWGAETYDPALHYASSQFFLVFNLVVFGLLAVLFALRSEREGHGLVDATLVFGAPLIGFGMQVGLVRHWEYGPAFSALGFAALYLPLALFLLRRWPQQTQRLTTSFLALGAGFATLAIPLALSARYTAMAWALEGLGLLWAGRSQREARMAWSGVLLLVLAAVAAAIAYDDGMDTASFLLVTATLALSWLAGAATWRRYPPGHLRGVLSDVEDIPAWVLWIGGITAWLLWLAEGTQRLFDHGDASLFALAGMLASVAAWRQVGARLAWPQLRCAAWLLWPFAAVVLIHQWLAFGRPFGAGWPALVWLPAIATAFWLLWQEDREGDSPVSLAALLPAQAGSAVLFGLHASLGWGVLAVTGSELLWHLNKLGWGSEEWQAGLLMAALATTVLAVWLADGRGLWPLQAQGRAWWLGALAPAVAALVLLLISTNALDGSMPKQAYLPLLNPLEQGAIFGLLMLWVWRTNIADYLPAIATRTSGLALAALAVWWANGLLLRTLAMLGGIDWDAETLWQSRLVQTSFALAWTLAALACMLIGTRRAERRVWISGAVVLGIVILKLFAVDAARGGGLARAVAFIGVALLVLAIGYFAPLPPRRDAADGDERADATTTTLRPLPDPTPENPS